MEESSFASLLWLMLLMQQHLKAIYVAAVADFMRIYVWMVVDFLDLAKDCVGSSPSRIVCRGDLLQIE